MTATLERVAPAAPMLAFAAEVRAVTRLSPGFVRLTLGGSCLDAFDRCRPLGPRDLRIKVVLPPPGRAPVGPADPFDLSPGWYPRWLARPADERGCLRTYTVRAVRDDPAPAGGTLVDVDVVLHDLDGAPGPGAAWAASARVGDPVTVLGPNAAAGDDGAAYGGIAWQPPVLRPGRRGRVLLAGDETAVPAICSILATLPPGWTGDALLEVPTAADALPAEVPAPDGPPAVHVRWLPRDGRAPGAALIPAVRDLLAAAPPTVRTADAAADLSLPDVDVDRELLWETPEHEVGRGDPFYAWVAAEAGVVREVRRHLVADLGVPRSQVAFMGYWRLGKPHAL